MVEKLEIGRNALQTCFIYEEFDLEILYHRVFRPDLF